MASASERVFAVFNYLLLSLFTLMCIYPFYYIFIYSLSDSQQVTLGFHIWPTGFTFANYSQIFQLPNILHSTLISVARVGVGVPITVFCCSFLAYLLSRDEMYLRKWLYRFVIVTMYLSAGLIPWYLTMKGYGLKNNFLLYVLPSAVAGFYVILFKTYIEQLPKALEESAMMDGAGYFTIYRSIIFPLSMPIVATIAVFAAVDQWNAWMDNFFLASSENLRTLQLILYNYLKRADMIASATNLRADQIKNMAIMSPTTVRMTITLIVTSPILFVYPFLQRFFIKGIMLGAVKG